MINAADKSMINAADKSMINAADKSMINAADKSMINAVDKSMINAADKSMINVADKILTVPFMVLMLVVIGTDCIGSCKSNYHTITTMTAPLINERDLCLKFESC
jgi:hypothetical protein